MLMQTPSRQTAPTISGLQGVATSCLTPEPLWLPPRSLPDSPHLSGTRPSPCWIAFEELVETALPTVKRTTNLTCCRSIAILYAH